MLIVALVREDFQENNFVYRGARGGVEITIFENNHAVKPRRATYEATIVYLVRRQGNLQMFTERHTLGLFPLATWRSLLAEAGFEIKETKREHAYDRFIRGEGKYVLRVFTCTKPLPL